ncbi:MAG: DUF3990 domain-containing protein [bacterium]|nr:DUF3990 domain-containing protein [Clostridium sp.]MCM1537489.1 DUF3990 domain-containing protein [bacterium]
MILYHGSEIEIRKPDIYHSRKNLDFGSGFYTTPLRRQAEKWCEKFVRRGRTGVISCYVLDDNILETCRILQFDSYSEEWLDFITDCRMGTDTEAYDMILGGVANDKVFNTCELYFKHYIDKDAALDRLRYEKPNHQICFKKQEIIEKYLRFEGSECL